MAVMHRLASALGRNDEVPNQQLAADIVKQGDRQAIRELVDGLRFRDRAIQHDCIKVLYEVGERDPRLIAPYADAFVDGLSSASNRMVWGAMTALGTIATFSADAIWKRIGEVMRANDAGSVITRDWGIRVLAVVSSKSRTYERRLFPYLMASLKKCITRDVPKHAESIVSAVNVGNRERYLLVLRGREKELKPAQLARIKKIYKRLTPGPLQRAAGRGEKP
jgi:hypothetical protein